MSVVAGDWVQAIGWILGFVVTIARLEANSKSAEKSVDDMRGEMRRQHTELGNKVDVLFGHTRELDGNHRELRSTVVQLETRTSRNESHIDEIGRTIGVGRRAPGG